MHATARDPSDASDGATDRGWQPPWGRVVRHRCRARIVLGLEALLVTVPLTDYERVEESSEWARLLGVRGGVPFAEDLDKTLAVTFMRTEPARIQVILASGGRSFDFDVVNA